MDHTVAADPKEKFRVPGSGLGRQTSIKPSLFLGSKVIMINDCSTPSGVIVTIKELCDKCLTRLIRGMRYYVEERSGSCGEGLGTRFRLIPC